MSTIGSGDRLYRLLPALYRQRDAAQGEPLRALLAAIEEELCVLEADIGRLYDNWFIETCAEWVVPYLGDLVGVRGLGDAKHLAFSQRTRVANALASRRRKGTLAALQDTAQDSAGWPTRAVEMFELLCATQHVQHPRPGRGTTVDLRARADLDGARGPFDSLARRVDVRRIATDRGRHNLSNIGLFVCRLQSYPLTHRAHAVASVPDGRYTFDPLGRDLPLFNRPQTPAGLARSATEADLPLPIGRRVFTADLDAYRIDQQGTPPGQRPPDSLYYGPRRSLAIVKDDRLVPPSELASADLSDWSRPKEGVVAVDIELGRLAFATGQEPASGVVVSYHYGCAADLGGGPYDRRASLRVAGPSTWHGRVVSANPGAASSSGPPTFATLSEALRAWIASGQAGVIEIADSESYDLPAIELPPHRSLAIQAADGVRPALSATTLTINAPGATAEAAADAALGIDGLLFAGEIRILGDLELELLHCSVPGGVSGGGHHHDLRLGIASSVVGGLRFPSEGVAIAAEDSVIEGPVTAAALTLHRVTLLGPASVKEIALASETIFAAAVVVERRHSGAMRFCYVAEGSTTPPRFRCQPDLALAGADGAQQARIRRRVAPAFTSRRFGDPAYAQLAASCAPEIGTGAEDGAEMGAFHHLHQPQRAANLRANLDAYLPLGLEAGIIYLT